MYLVRTDSEFTMGLGHNCVINNTVDLSSIINNIAGDSFQVQIQKAFLTYYITNTGNNAYFGAEVGLVTLESGAAFIEFSSLDNTGGCQINDKLESAINKHFNFKKKRAALAFPNPDDISAEGEEHLRINKVDITQEMKKATKYAESLMADEPVLSDYVFIVVEGVVGAESEFEVITFLEVEYDTRHRQTPRNLFP
jgi:hypothetical protein